MRSEFEYQKRPRRQWKVVQEFGSKGGGLNGGIARVELKDDPIDRNFIEKRFQASHVTDPYFAEKEISLMYQLQDHENIAKMVDDFLDAKAMKASIYMEFCNAGDMEDVIRAVREKKQYVHEGTIWKWFMGCMDALVYIHYGPRPDDYAFTRKYWNQIYHRDIKPGNVFLKREDRKKEIVAKLADFGCSVSDQWAKLNKTQKEASHASAHTPGFDPPEHPDFSVLTDVWQMSLCIACVCTGSMNPQSKENPTGQKWNTQQPAGPQYTRELNDVLKWCLTEDKKRRPDSRAVLKRLKEKYSKIKNTLPRNNRPMDTFWQSVIDIRTGGAQQPASSPRPRVVNSQLECQEHRPGLLGHALSDPGVGRTEPMGNRYSEMVHNQRRVMSPNSIDEVIHDGGGYPYPGLPGSFVPGFGSGYLPPGYGRGSGSGSPFDRRHGSGWRQMYWNIK
jgi:serine/threonine protein kinase